MENATAQPPIEDSVSSANCAHCGKEILVETVTIGVAVRVPHRRVVGAFVQFVDDHGLPFGPWWAMCVNCKTDPLALPEVQAAYQRMKQEQ